MNTKILKIAALSTLILFACKRDELDFSKKQNITINPEMAVPILKTKLTLGDYINEDSDSTIEIGANKSISIVYRDPSIMEVVAGDLFELSDQNFYDDAVSIGSFRVGPFTAQGGATLGDILDNISPSEIGDSVKARDGKVDYFPEIPAQSVGGYAEQTFSEFKSIYVSEGIMDVLIINGLQVDLENLVLSVRNKVDSSVVTSINVPLLPATSNLTKTVDLAGAMMTNQIFVEFENFSSPGSGPDPFDTSKHVLISTNDQLVFRMNIPEIVVDSGEVVIPDQFTDGIGDTVDFQATNGEEIDLVEMRSGSLVYSVNSGFKEDVQFTIKLPTARRGGAEFSEVINVAAGSNSTGVIDLSGYAFAFNEMPSQNFNKLPLHVDIAVTSGGGFVKFSSTDQIVVNLGMENVVYEYIQGYFGQSNIQVDPFTSITDFSFIQKLKGDFRFFNPYFRMTVENGIGLPTNIALDVNGHNTEKGSSEALGAPELTVPYPSFAQRGQTIIDTLEINNTNSNVVNFMSIVPDSIVGSGVVSMNPNGSTANRNFIYNDSKLKFGLEVEVPLEIAVDGLELERDTGIVVDLNLGDAVDIDSIQINFNITNGFPLSADLELYLNDSLMNPLDTIYVKALEGAPVDVDGRVINPVFLSTKVMLKGAEIENFMNTRVIGVKAIVNTTGSNIPTKVALFTDYFIELQLAAKARISYTY